MTQLQLINEPRLYFKGAKAHRARVIRAWWLFMGPWDADWIAVDEYKEFRSDRQLIDRDPAEFKRLSRQYGTH